MYIVIYITKIKSMLNMIHYIHQHTNLYSYVIFFPINFQLYVYVTNISNKFFVFKF